MYKRCNWKKQRLSLLDRTDMGNQVLKGWNRACTNVGSSVGSLPEYITSQSLTEAEKREQKKFDAEEKMVRQTIEYLDVVMKSDTQELAGIEDKTSTEYAEIAKRLSGNMERLKEEKIRLAEVSVKMKEIREKSLTQAGDSVVSTTKDITYKVVDVSQKVATKTVAVTKEVGSAIGSGINETVKSVKKMPGDIKGFVDNIGDQEGKKKTSKNKIVEQAAKEEDKKDNNNSM